STAAAIIITRTNESAEITGLVRRQMLAQPSVLYTVAGVIAVIALVPGMPHLAFLSFAALIAFVGWRTAKFAPIEEAESLDKVAALSRDLRQDKPQPLAWEDIPLVERLSVSLGYKLVGLVNDAGGSPLPLRIRGVRQTLSEQLGFLLPEVHIRDSLR